MRTTNPDEYNKLPMPNALLYFTTLRKVGELGILRTNARGWQAARKALQEKAKNKGVKLASKVYLSFATNTFYVYTVN